MSMKKAFFEKAFENLMHMLSVLFEGVKKNQDVIEVDYVGLVNEFSKDVINVGPKSTRCTVKVKRHNKVFELSIVGMESCFVFIICGNSEEVEGVSKV